jgi:hypothetical protein
MSELKLPLGRSLDDLLLHYVVPPELISETNYGDIANEYIVFKLDQEYGGVIVYGKYQGDEWYANPSGRVIISKLLNDKAQLEAEVADWKGKSIVDEKYIRNLIDQLHGHRELWVDECNDENKAKAQAEADEHGVNVYVNVHGLRKFVAKPSIVATLRTQLSAKVAQDAMVQTLTYKKYDPETDKFYDGDSIVVIIEMKDDVDHVNILTFHADEDGDSIEDMNGDFWGFDLTDISYWAKWQVPNFSREG